jgi:hypothetical protein
LLSGAGPDSLAAIFNTDSVPTFSGRRVPGLANQKEDKNIYKFQLIGYFFCGVLAEIPLPGRTRDARDELHSAMRVTVKVRM